MADELGTERPCGILRYHRDELSELQQTYGRLQEEWWVQLLTDLGPDVAEELHELQAVPDASPCRRRSKNSERRLRSKAKREALHSLSMNAFVSDRDGHDERDSCPEDSSHPCWQKDNENSAGRSHIGKGSRNNRTFYTEDKPEAESFQPPAFSVEGEPDFESGPPQDGWEYLRRVKYEAAQCPKVVVAAIDSTKLISEQTQYMPEIPEIPVCTPDLLPSKEWEKHFVGDFSLLRMALSNMHVPPKSLSERIPSVRNKAAWEVLCFGSMSSVQHDDSEEPDIVTAERPTTESGEQLTVTATDNLSLKSCDSAQNESDFVANERLELVDNEQEPQVPFMEVVETGLDQLFNAGSAEENYVIDLGLLKARVPIYGELDGSFNASEYLISEEPAEVYDVLHISKASCSTVGVPEPKDDPASNIEFFGSHDSNVEELGREEDLSSGITTHFQHLTTGDQPDDNVDMTPSSSYLRQVFIESDRLTTSDVMDSIGTSAHVLAHVELESSTGTVIQAEVLQTKEVEDAGDGIEFLEPSSNYFEIIECEDGQQPSADSMNTLGCYPQPFDHVDFEELHGEINTQFEYLSIGDREGVQSKMEAMLPSFSDPESSELDDVHLPTTNFMDSLVGLEIYRSGNILQDEPNEILDASGHSGKLEIDESLEELFTKVFQLVGVSQLPFIHLLLRLDEVSRAALFRYHVSWLENVNGLPQDRALWLLSLSAVVDTPLDAQTGAAFRALLRRCAGIRALKQTRDDKDLYMLNVLIAVAGLYFGQAETPPFQ